MQRGCNIRLLVFTSKFYGGFTLWFQIEEVWDFLQLQSLRLLAWCFCFVTVNTDHRSPHKLKKAQIPDQLWLGMHVPHAILRKSLVQAVEGGSEKASYNPHKNEEAQVHSRPEVAFLIRLWALCAENHKNKHYSCCCNFLLMLLSPQQETFSSCGQRGTILS